MYHRDQLDVGKYTIHACYWVTVILYPNAPPNGIFAYIWPKVMVKCIGKSFIHGASGVVSKISGTPTHGARHDVASPGCQVRTNSVRGAQKTVSEVSWMFESAIKWPQINMDT